MAQKKYYWLKLKRDFFKRHDIQIIEQMPNGKDYLLFYLKMLLESIDHDGALRFSETIPYNEQMLSIVTNTNIDVVKAAMKLLIELGMVEIFDDNTIYMNEVKRMIGSAVDSDAANRQRRCRERKKQAELPSVTNCHAVCDKKSREIEKEKDIDIELDIEKEKEREISCEQVADLFKTLCPSLPSLKIISDSIKSDLEESITKYSIDDFKLLFKKAEASTFLKGENERKWVASFDWLIKADNVAKVLNGKFDNKKDPKRTYDFEALENWLNRPEPVTAAEDENIKARAEALKQQFAKD